jgi:hypothetical protein
MGIHFAWSSDGVFKSETESNELSLTFGEVDSLGIQLA